jgi:hypothetical protein
MGKLSDLLKAQVEELKRQDEDNMREMQAIINRCNSLLDELTLLSDD